MELSDYQLSLNPWVLLMKTQKAEKAFAVARFRKRNDAEEHSIVLKRKILHVEFEIVYQPPTAEGATK